jgi:serine protease AprX
MPSSALRSPAHQNRAMPPRRALALACLMACGGVAAAEIDPRVVAAAKNAGSADALIVFAPAASSLTPLATTADYRVRRRALVDLLQAQAEATQRDSRAWLDAHGIAYRSYWVANVIEAQLPSSALAELARQADVVRIESNPAIRMQLPRPDASTFVPNAIESIGWGVTKIGAPSVWAAGFNGQGVVIAGEDTGYQWDHPALKPHYRGWDGAVADHNHNWHDAIHDAAAGNVCNSDSPFPCDDNAHGTHTAGTFVGDDGGTNQTGVAPGAKWIGCRNMDAGVGTPARYIECMQWMLAPTDLAGANADPDLAPDIVSNSWGCPTAPPEQGGEGCTPSDILESAVDNLVAGGILFVASAGNGGSGCGLIDAPPALYDASFVVGATDSSDRLANFSLRGPVAGANRVRPDISAPGVSVCSSVPPNAYSCSFSGTSMAAPHVAGTAALLMAVNPALKGHPDQVADILRATARTTGVTDPVNQTCGGTTASQWPNNMLGAGRVDAYAAMILADTIFKDGFEDGATLR